MADAGLLAHVAAQQAGRGLAPVLQPLAAGPAPQHQLEDVVRLVIPVGDGRGVGATRRVQHAEILVDGETHSR